MLKDIQFMYQKVRISDIIRFMEGIIIKDILKAFNDYVILPIKDKAHNKILDATPID